MTAETPNAGPVRVLLVEDHPIVAEGVARRGEASGGAFTVVAVASTVEQALALYAEHRPEVVLCDVGLGSQQSGFDVVRGLLADHPKAAVVMYSAQADTATVKAALDAGACGFISKQANPGDLADAMVDAARGATVFDNTTAAAVIEMLRRPLRESYADKLSPREREVLELLCAGVSRNKRIAEALGISEHSVKSHVDGLLAKLGVDDRTQAVAYAFREGLVS